MSAEGTLALRSNGGPGEARRKPERSEGPYGPTCTSGKNLQNLTPLHISSNLKKRTEVTRYRDKIAIENLKCVDWSVV